MFNNEVVFYGDYANKIQDLKDTGLFLRLLDVYLTAGVVGLLFNKKGIKKIDKNGSKKIFVEQLISEMDRIKYLSSLAFLIENFDLIKDKNSKAIDVNTEKDLLKQAFGDWFGIQNDDSERKYDLFYEYVLGGINILHEKIINTSSKERYYENFSIFLQEVKTMEISDPRDRIFADFC